MLKNKIYRYFLKEIGKTFITILFAFTAVAWTVRAVNFLDLIVDNGHSLRTYLFYSLLNITNIITKFIPLSFFITLMISITKFERQNELVILWTNGLNKIKLVNVFMFFSILVFLIQFAFSTFITPSTLNKSRSLIRTSDFASISSIIKINDLTDSFKNLTFFVEKKSDENIMENIFIRDEANIFNSLTTDKNNTDTTIIAKKGYLENKKLLQSSEDLNQIISSSVNDKDLIEDKNKLIENIKKNNLLDQKKLKDKIIELKIANEDLLKEIEIFKSENYSVNKKLKSIFSKNLKLKDLNDKNNKKIIELEDIIEEQNLIIQLLKDKTPHG